MTSKPTITLLFSWKQFVPDTRAYKPSAPVIETSYQLGIDVPLVHEFIHNSAAIIQAQIGTSDVPQPILTPLGMRYCIDQFEAVMVNPDAELQSDESAWDEGDNDENDPTVKKPAAKTPSADDEEDWEEAPAETTTKEDKDWDESWEV